MGTGIRKLAPIELKSRKLDTLPFGTVAALDGETIILYDPDDALPAFDGEESVPDLLPTVSESLLVKPMEQMAKFFGTAGLPIKEDREFADSVLAQIKDMTPAMKTHVAERMANEISVSVVAYKLALSIKRRKGCLALWLPVMKRAYNLLMAGK